ncbi:MAG: transcriptional repressor LexA [Dehalococcoidia bacterium]
MREISERQQNMLGFIEEFLDDYGYPPTVRDIQTGCDISSTSVVDYNLKALIEKGYINRDAEVSRGLQLVQGIGQRSEMSDLVAVPLLGTIAAGNPFPLPAADSQGVETIDLPQSITGSGENIYALRVKGESMIDALIADGDLVVMEQTSSVENGQTAAVRLKLQDETTLKRFYREGQQVRLQPENSSMDPIICDATNVEVLSRLVAVWRFIG